MHNIGIFVYWFPLLFKYYDQFTPVGYPRYLIWFIYYLLFLPSLNLYIYLSLFLTYTHFVDWGFFVVWGLKVHPSNYIDSFIFIFNYLNFYCFFLYAVPFPKRFLKWSWLFDLWGIFYLLFVLFIKGLNVQF